MLPNDTTVAPVSSFDEARAILDELALEPVNAQETDFGKAILLGLQAHEKHVYQGTTDPAATARRREANKRARKSRVANARRARAGK